MSEIRHYETTVVINAGLEEKQIKDAIGRVQDFFEKNEATIERADEWGRKRLAYPIAKKNNGYYMQYEFTAPGSVDIEKGFARFCRIDEDILRELTLVLSNLDLKRRAEAEARMAEAEAAAEKEEEGGGGDSRDRR